MTTVEVFNGSCGYLTRVVGCRETNDIIRISIATDCQSIRQWGLSIESIEWRSCFGKNAQNSTFWQSAFDILKHRSCPVIIGVLRAIETEMDIAPPADAQIRFMSAG
jgi:hypothetical protein